MVGHASANGGGLIVQATKAYEIILNAAVVSLRRQNARLDPSGDEIRTTPFLNHFLNSGR